MSLHFMHPFYGVKAMAALFDAMDKKVRDSPAAPMDLGELKVFDTFQFLMTPCQKATQKEWVGSCFKGHAQRAQQAPAAPQAKAKHQVREGSSTSSLFSKKRRT